MPNLALNMTFNFHMYQMLKWFLFDPLEQCFSTFFSSRHTKQEIKFGGTLNFLNKLNFPNCKQNLLIFLKRIVKARPKKLAALLEGAHGTLVCRGTPVEKHCPWVSHIIWRAPYPSNIFRSEDSTQLEVNLHPITNLRIKFMHTIFPLDWLVPGEQAS